MRHNAQMAILREIATRSGETVSRPQLRRALKAAQRGALDAARLDAVLRERARERVARGR